MSLIFFALPQKRIISSRTTGRPSRPPTRCINRRRSRRHHLDPDHPNLARPPLLGPAQDSRSHHRSPYQLGRRYSNLAPDLSAWDTLIRVSCIVYQNFAIRSWPGSFHSYSSMSGWFCKGTLWLDSISSLRARARDSRISLTEQSRRRAQS